MKKQMTDSAHVIAPPPLIYAGGLVLGFSLRYLKPLGILEGDFLRPLGLGLIVVSIVFFIWSVKSFVKARTNVDVRRPTTLIVDSGLYRFSRNPIYISMTILYLGITFWVNDLWLLVMLIPVLLIIQYGVIKREEVYLTKKFGETYKNYKKTVRRWL